MLFRSKHSYLAVWWIAIHWSSKLVHGLRTGVLESAACTAFSHFNFLKWLVSAHTACVPVPECALCITVAVSMIRLRFEPYFRSQFREMVLGSQSFGCLEPRLFRLRCATVVVACPLQLIVGCRQP